ncbi:RecQ family ATP-dependent DNA helicase [Flavobacterium terrisoli]|uniref:RecQ family ATP-dependent DNA helicase n=1 Tax=Flavobacterium terrisoli TaxID=3242195 RepID=UPI002543E07C|nr:RecQ family ATP-dependent DNA helicase [Flavobacterium buctense]
MSTKATAAFEEYFPSMAEKFELKPLQEKVINNIVNGTSTLTIMPTGGGKSLIYWVAAKALEGTCMVISPLIALIDEQAEKLRNEGCEVLVIHGGIKAAQQVKTLTKFANGDYVPDFIFASPERMATDGLFEYCITKQRARIKLFVIDEVHCISQWGFDFRPFYKHIPQFLDNVFESNWPIILGLTATINPKELSDITGDFKIANNAIVKDDVLLRLDIDLKVEKISDEEDKRERLWQLLDEHRDDKVLVYLYRKYRRGGVEELCDTANAIGYNAISFHGDLTSAKRQEIISDFKTGSKNIVFATNAFGMGIDLPDIRVVIHYMLPESIEQYYQEIGRAGRDKKGATAYILYSNKNIKVRKEQFIDKAFPKGNTIVELYKTATNNESGKKTLQYFSEEELQSALPYFINCGAITIAGKGFTSLKVFKSNTNPELQEVLNISKTGLVGHILKKTHYSNLSCIEFFNITYSAIVTRSAQLSKNLDKCLILDAAVSELTPEQLALIEIETEEKRIYKHNLLDYLVYLLENFESSVALHQEIGRYLGVKKHLLDKIHQTENDIWVRSKSELVIANILYRSGMDFTYEEKLYYNDRQWKEPDFTIRHNGQTWYWEHLGLLGDEKYNEDWQNKKQIYKDMGIMEQVVTTKESSILSLQANSIIQKIIESKHD